MNFSKIETIISCEKKYRQDQVRQVIFRDLIENWEEASTLPKELREKLIKECPLEIKPKILEAKDGKSSKALIMLEDEAAVETVLMRHQGRQTICLSSQVGCALGCVFCATGKNGFKRNLTADEILRQVIFWARHLKKDKKRVDNIVFMGMGEPFLNYDNVWSAIKIINDAKGLAIGSRHISISTAGIVAGIKKMAGEPLQVNLAISLHAPDDQLRSSLMPINKKHSIGRVFEAVDEYILKTRRKVMVEYIMIKGVNDSPAHARQLVKLLERPLVFVNLIAYNPTGIFHPSSAETIKKFKDILMAAGIQAIERYRFGQDVEAACGQLAGKIKRLSKN